MQTGYQQEAYGPDASYQGLSTCIQAAYYRLSNDTVARDGLQRIFNLFNHTVVPEPDGSKVGATNFSHRTKMPWTHTQYGAGIPLLQGILPEAACLAQPNTGETPPLATLLTPPNDIYRPAIGYSTSTFAPFLQCISLPYPATPPGPSCLCRPKTTSSRNFNNEFLAWRRPDSTPWPTSAKPGAWHRRVPQNSRKILRQQQQAPAGIKPRGCPSSG